MRRKLALKRETLTDLELRGVRGGSQSELCLDPTDQSCLDYISCWWWQCITQKLIEDPS